jgi:hypothetical protein
MAEIISSAEGWQADKNRTRIMSITQDIFMVYISL